MDGADLDGEDSPLLLHGARLAGALWVGYGVLASAAWLTSLWPWPGAGAPEAAAGLVVGAGCLSAGLPVATGRAADTRDLGVASVALSATLLALAALIWRISVTVPGDESVAAIGGVGVGLLVPGVLALAGRRDYLVWRAQRSR